MFYPTIKTVYDLQMYGPSMRCIKNPAENIKIWGNYNTGAAGAIMVVFEKCNNKRNDGEVECASEEDIAEWIEGRYLITNENEKRFI